MSTVEEAKVKAANLIKSFEDGEAFRDSFGNVVNQELAESLLAKPGTTQKLVTEYETIAAPKEAPAIVRMKSANPKNVLVVSAHSVRAEGSLGDQLLKATLKMLKKQGHDVQVSDLIEMKFNPVATVDDIQGDAADKYKHMFFGAAAQTGDVKLAADILAEQAKVQFADLIILLFPLQLHGLPAILKGWFDRVMTYGFAFKRDNLYDTGLLKGKKVVLCTNTPVPASCYTATGVDGDLGVYLWPIQYGILRRNGLDVLQPHFITSTMAMDDECRKATAEDWSQRVSGFFEEDAMQFLPTAKFNPEKHFSMADKDVEELCKNNVNTVGHHFGKTLPITPAIIVEGKAMKQIPVVVVNGIPEAKTDEAKPEKTAEVKKEATETKKADEKKAEAAPAETAKVEAKTQEAVAEKPKEAKK